MIDDKIAQYNDLNKDVKDYLLEKEQDILNSQLRIGDLKSTINKLEKEKRKVTRQKIILTIIARLIGDIIILSMLVSYLMPLIKVLEIAPLTYQVWLIIAVYTGVLAISFLGAYVMSKIEKVLRKKIDAKYLTIINQITKQQAHITVEIELQETLKKEIDSVRTESNPNKKDILPLQEKISPFKSRESYPQDIYAKEISQNPTHIRTRRRKK